eukprot:scaffold8216_cov58-Cylindrotheca_fusiformis.AAC.2
MATSSSSSSDDDGSDASSSSLHSTRKRAKLSNVPSQKQKKTARIAHFRAKVKYHLAPKTTRTSNTKKRSIPEDSEEDDTDDNQQSDLSSVTLSEAASQSKSCPKKPRRDWDVNDHTTSGTRPRVF